MSDMNQNNQTPVLSPQTLSELNTPASVSFEPKPEEVKPVEEAPIPNVSSVEELAYKEEYTDYEEYDNYEPAEPEVPAEESTPAMASDVQAILDGVLTEQPDETAGKGGAEE